MVRKIIKIDEGKCNGCGLCVSACHEGAIGLVNSKAKLLRDDYCDGLGDCLPVCPTGAIAFEEREALEYNEAAVKNNLESRQKENLQCGCPGIFSKSLAHNCNSTTKPVQNVSTHLNQWPVQIKLVPPKAPYFENAHLLIAADCVAYAYGNFHAEYMHDKITIIGCPKLDDGDYCGKLTTIIKMNNIKSVTVARMEVPCCRGLELTVKTALQNSGKSLPYRVEVIPIPGN